MFQKGVTCMDCHEPHSLKLRVEGNSLCGHCHNAETFDTKSITFTRPETPVRNASTATCRSVPTWLSIRGATISFACRRPDISAAVGSPDACTSCHDGKAQQWAAEAMDGWYGKTWRNRPTDALALHAGVIHGARHWPDLLAIAKDQSRPANVRAAALSLAQEHARRESFAELPSYLADPDPLVRIAALGWVGRLQPQQRVSIAGKRWRMKRERSGSRLHRP